MVRFSLSVHDSRVSTTRKVARFFDVRAGRWLTKIPTAGSAPPVVPLEGDVSTRYGYPSWPKADWKALSVFSSKQTKRIRLMSVGVERTMFTAVVAAASSG